MIAFKLRINGGEAIVAGAPDLCVIYAQFHLMGKLGDRTHYNREPQSLCWLGGLARPTANLSEQESVDWHRGEPLKVGDVISIEIIEAGPDEISPVLSRMPFRDRPGDANTASTRS